MTTYLFRIGGSFFEAKSFACRGDFARKGKQGNVCIKHVKKGAQFMSKIFNVQDRQEDKMQDDADCQ